MSKSTYKARPGSIATRLLQHLQQNPTAVLTTAAVAKAFGGKPTAMQTTLARAVSAKLLTRTPSGGPRKQLQYAAGPALAAFDLTPKAKAAPAPAPAAIPVDPTTAALCQYGTYCTASDTLTLNARQRERLCLVIGAYMLSAANVLEAAA